MSNVWSGCAAAIWIMASLGVSYGVVSRPRGTLWNVIVKVCCVFMLLGVATSCILGVQRHRDGHRHVHLSASVVTALDHAVVGVVMSSEESHIVNEWLNEYVREVPRTMSIHKVATELTLPKDIVAKVGTGKTLSTNERVVLLEWALLLDERGKGRDSKATIVRVARGEEIDHESRLDLLYELTHTGEYRVMYPPPAGFSHEWNENGFEMREGVPAPAAPPAPPAP